MRKYNYVTGKKPKPSRKRTKADDIEYYYEDESLELPSLEVFLPDYDEDLDLEETGVLDSTGQPILRQYVIPKRVPAGFVRIEDDEDE
jgi:hypothetical protein